MESIDVCFVHPPSIYDFRTKEIKLGPISDVVPSTPVFEMYPIGFVSMLAYLVKHGYKARIANIAVQMLSNPKFNVEAYIRGINASVFAVDLHWLPHVHGAYHISKMIKRIHPNAKVVLGGFSATYFSGEIMKEWPWIDYVLYGDYQEEPLLMLAEAVETGGGISTVHNLVYHSHTNAALESSIGEAKKAGCKKFDVYFMIGLSGQGRADVEADMDYASYLIKKYNGEGMDLDAFIAPLAPFVDPASLFFEMPDRYGYKLKAKHIMEFYNLLDKGKSWEDHLNYETDTMSKKDIIESTYMAGIKMVETNAAAGKMDEATAASMISGIRDYISGKPYVTDADMSRHLTYLNKQIEGSRKHRITPLFASVFAYRIYDSVLGRLGGMKI